MSHIDGRDPIRPRSIQLRAGRFLFAENQASDSIELFEIDSITGHLEPTGQTIEVATPVCIKFLPLSD